ncbi:MAG TPA: hypothetical protein VMG09_04625 [Bacteroidota bacterium]|nr:hypothetical protein [Bacteroidota bacterium]
MTHAQQIQKILDDRKTILEYLRRRYPMIHASNIFFRDLVFGLQAYLAAQGVKMHMSDAEKCTRIFIDALVEEGTLIPCDQQTWTLNYPSFRTPVHTPAAAKATA